MIFRNSWKDFVTQSHLKTSLHAGSDDDVIISMVLRRLQAEVLVADVGLNGAFKMMNDPEFIAKLAVSVRKDLALPM